MKGKLDPETLYEGIGQISDKWLTLLDGPVPTEQKEERRFVGYELRKLLGVKYLWVFLFVFLMLNSVLAWNAAGRSSAARDPMRAISEYFAANPAGPAGMGAGQDALDRAARAAREYPETIDRVIDRAYANLDSFADMGVGEDSFTRRYQLRVIELYEAARDSVELQVEYVRGWEEYFSYDTVNVFIFLMLVMLGSIIFAQEKQTGFLPIMRTARYGRARTAVSKILTMLLLSSVFVVMFTLSTFAVYGLRIGFSSPGNAIQALSPFTLSPYRISIGEYFAVTLGVKLLTFAAFSMIVLALSVVFYNYILIYFAGLGLFGINFLFYTISYVDANSVFKNLNLVTAAAVKPLFVRYRAMNFFGNVAGFVPSLCVIFPLVIVVCAVVLTVLYVRGTSGVRVAWIDAALARCMTAAARVRRLFTPVRRAEPRRPRKPRRARVYSRSLVLAEAYKTLVSSRLFVVVLLILCVKVWYSAKINAPAKSYADAVYEEYMTVLEGEVTEEKLAYIAAERAAIDETLARLPVMEQLHAEDEISFEEWSAFISEYTNASSRTKLLEAVEEQAAYLQEKEAETGIRGWFLYDTGWSKFYSEDADLFLYASVLLLLTGSFAAEYVSRSSAGEFAGLLRSTKNGRDRTFRAKLISSGTIALLLAVLTGAADAAIIFGGYDMPAGNAPLLSLQMFSDVTGSITVAQYFALFSLMRIVGTWLMAMLVCALSELLAKYVPVLGAAVVLTLLPALCVYFGFAAAGKVNFLNLLAGTPLFLQSARTPLFGSGYAMLVLWLAVAAAAVTAMILPARKKFVE